MFSRERSGVRSPLATLGVRPPLATFDSRVVSESEALQRHPERRQARNLSRQTIMGSLRCRVTLPFPRSWSGILNVDTMRTRVQKWGNSLALRIPKPFADEVGLRPSAEVEVFLREGELRVAPVRLRWDLSELLSKVTKRNRHSEVGTGPVRGREVW